jgi:hypothetical protein
MTKWRIPILRLIVVAALAAFAVVTASAQMSQASDNHKGYKCSIGTIAGNWVFATDIGYVFLGAVRVTALGTFNVGSDGSVSGTFDFNATDGFGGGLTYNGTVEVHPDCTGIVGFTDSLGQPSVQSIVIARGGQEIWGAWQDPTGNTVWTYKAKRTK